MSDDLGLELIRQVSVPAEYRAASDDSESIGTLEVRFSQFNTWYEINSFWEGRYLERTVKGAFAKTIKESARNVKALYDHGFDPQIGNKVLGDITSLSEEEDSPLGVVELFDTSYNRDLLPGLRAGVYGSSFRFRVVKDEWNQEPGKSKTNPEGLPERSITEVRLFEFGPVTFPANPASTAGMRSGTDDYYERLRATSPQVQELLARTKPRQFGTPQGAAVDDPDEPREHSDATPSHRHLRLMARKIGGPLWTPSR